MEQVIIYIYILFNKGREKEALTLSILVELMLIFQTPHLEYQYPLEEQDQQFYQNYCS